MITEVLDTTPRGAHARLVRWPNLLLLTRLLGGTHPMSASTVGMLGRGRKQMTPRLLADFAAVLGMDASDLAVMAEIELPPEELPVHPHAPQMAELIWELRRLTYEQVRQLIEHAKPT
jgi:hypothetical protein